MIPAPKTKEELAVLILDLQDCRRTLTDVRKYLRKMIEGGTPNLLLEF